MFIRQVIDYYERRGEFNYRLLVQDIAQGLDQFLTFTELSPEMIVEKRRLVLAYVLSSIYLLAM